jgi:hypothetical protein
VHVVYGFVELKIHAKVTLIVRREENGLRSYVHFGTGRLPPVHGQGVHGPVPVHRRRGAHARRQPTV